MLSEKFEPSSPHILSKACNTYYYTTARIWHLSFNSSTLENDDYSETVWETFAKIISGCNFFLPLARQWRQPSPPVSCEEVCVKWSISFPISSYFIRYNPALLSARAWNNEMQIILPHISWYDRSWQTFGERKMAIFFSCFAVFATNVSSLRIIPNLQSLSKSWWGWERRFCRHSLQPLARGQFGQSSPPGFISTHKVVGLDSFECFF